MTQNRTEKLPQIGCHGSNVFFDPCETHERRTGLPRAADPWHPGLARFEIISISPAILVALILASAGCKVRLGGGPSDYDEMRAKIVKLEPALEAANRRADAAERALQQHLESKLPAPLPEGVLPPLLSGVELVSQSRGIDTDKDGRDDAARLYLNTFDQHSRFTQATATVGVTLTAANAGQEAVTLATKRFDAKEFFESYRSGFGGTHYTLVVPFEKPPPQGVAQITVTLELTDLLTGATHKTEKIVPVTNP